MAKSTTLIELSTPLEVNLNIDAPESSPTGSSIKINVNIDSALLSEDFRIFGALIDERILTFHEVSNMTKTFLTAPSALEVIIKESQLRRPYPVQVIPDGMRRIYASASKSSGGGMGEMREMRNLEEMISRTRSSRRSKTRSSMDDEYSVDLSPTVLAKGESISTPELIMRTNFAESVLLNPIQIKNDSIKIFILH